MSGTWSAARRVVGVRLDTIGDVLMTTPALRALRGGGERHVTLLTSSAGAAVASLVPEIDDVIVFDAPWMKASAPVDGRTGLDMVSRLRSGRFDAAVVFTVYTQNPLPSAQLCHLADIPLRAAHCRENPYQLLTDWVRETEPEQGVRHEAQRQLDLVGALGFATADPRLSLAVPPAADAAVAELLGDLRAGGLADARWVLVHPGATAPSRRYPPELFSRVATRLAALGWQVVFTGSAAECELVAGIQAAVGAPTTSLAGRLDLAGLAALIARAPLLVANNTGPVHMAAALGTPVVDLYALTNPQHTPWMVPHRTLSHDVPCRWCYRSVCPQGHHDCLRRVEPERVVDAACELLDATRARRAEV